MNNQFSNRRQFIKTAVVAAAGAPLLHGLVTKSFAAEPGRKLGFAVVGLGNLSTNQIAPALLKTKNCRLAAIVTGHPAKAEKWKAQYGIVDKNIYNYGNMEKMADNPDIDVVYVVTPNALHAEHTLKAAQAGKHVLCEKPMEVSTTKCQAMIDACKKAGRLLAIGYRCQFEPHHLECARLAREKVFGNVKTIEAGFGFTIGDPTQWRLNRALSGGGPLMDVGIYSLNACRYLTGQEPEHIAAYASTIDRDGRFKEVEENVSWTMRFPSGIVASCSTTYGANMAGYFKVYGSKGWLQVDNAFVYEGLHLRAQLGSETLDEPNPARDPSQFQAEAEHFSHCLQNNLDPQSPGEEGLRDMKYITEIYRSAGISV